MDPQDDRLVTIPQAELAEMLDEVGRMGGCLRFQAHGRSMAPFVRSGDTLIIEPFGGCSARAGDVLLYRTPGGGVAAHRVTGSHGSTLRVRGDRLAAPLELVEACDVLGRVAAIERRGTRRPLAWLRVLALSWIVIRPVLRACRNRLGAALAAMGGSGPTDQPSSRRPSD